MEQQTQTWTAFEGLHRLRTGALADVALAAQAAGPETTVLVFEDATGRQIDLDLRGSPQALAARYAPAVPEPRGRGRPRLGVTAREVTLLPRHWDWLAAQPGGASVALRKLVEQARRDPANPMERRRRHEAAYRFMSALAGDLPGFEEAIRALFADDRRRFGALVEAWPRDVASHAEHLAWGDRDPV